MGFCSDFIGLFLTYKSINCLGHKQSEKSHTFFLYSAVEVMFNGRDI